MDLEMRHFRLVEAIVAEGGLTRAGARLHLTQSALSHQLRDLEAHLGTPLFLRLKRRMVPTPAGERLLLSARQVLDEARAAEEEIHRRVRDGEGLIRIAVQCYTCYHWLPALLEPFRRRHPRVEVRIAAEETRQTAQALFDGRLDLALLSDPRMDPRLVYRHLVDDEMVVVMAPGHRLAKAAFVPPHELADETLFMYTEPQESMVMQRVLRPLGVTPRRIVKVILTEAILELVRAGQGVAVLASWSIAPCVAAGAVVARPFGRQGLVRRWHAVRLKVAAAPDYLLAFEDLLAKHPPSGRLPAKSLSPPRSPKARERAGRAPRASRG
ncbi:MAG TPA: LysR family transcriptional regulator [Dongiaceae bacterium]|nr:LysR family transcriptional regulator [Dongiaceae bacterium]